MASEFERGLVQGRKEGRTQERKEILDWLEEQYLKKTVLRGSEKGKAILKLAGELSKVMKSSGL